MEQEMLMESGTAGIVAQARETLHLMHNWGYAPTLSVLARDLLGGEVSTESLEAALQGPHTFQRKDGLVVLPGYEFLLKSSKQRQSSNRILNGHARKIAESFAEKLATLCPYVQCVALSGSVASGGYQSGDDIDFDLIVEPGTKYVSYLAANLIGLTYSWRFRKARVSGLQRSFLLPKIVCINVVWQEAETKPFVRQDAAMAFELLRCQPLVGTNTFGQVLAGNRWLSEFFPQLLQRSWVDSVNPGNSRIGRFLRSVGRRPRALRLLNRGCRILSWTLYTLVQISKKGDAVARARMEFLKTVKYPYEVFQD
jgi:hypothetical protein